MAGMHGVILEVRNLLDKATKSVKIVESTIAWLTNRDYRKLEELAEKKISIAIIATEACKTELKRLADLKANVKIHNKPDVAFYIIDDQIVLVRLNSPDTGTIIQDSNVAKMFSAKFNQINKSANEIEVDKVVS